MTDKEIFRQQLIESLRRELVGPEWAKDSDEQPADILQESPVQRYSAGVLFPPNQPITELEDIAEEDADPLDEELLTDDPGTEDAPIDDQAPDPRRDSLQADNFSDVCDETVRLANEYFPAAIGLTLIADVSEEGLLVSPRAAIYRSQAPSDPKTRLREWHRQALTIAPVRLRISAASKDMDQADLAEGLRLRWIHHRRSDGSCLLTVSMINTRLKSKKGFPSGRDCFFQVEFDVVHPEGKAVFHEYRTVSQLLDDPEEASLELLYRNRMAYAVGHGCAAEWGEDLEGRTNRVSTASVPAFKVAPVEPRTEGGEELSMFFLAGGEGETSAEQIVKALGNLPSDYRKWISEQEANVQQVPQRLQQAAQRNLAQCRECCDRIRKGIELLGRSPRAMQAFMLANRAILMQQDHSRRPRRKAKDPWAELPQSYRPSSSKRGRWRTFQLAFILMNLNSMVAGGDGQDLPERDLVDLIWFPTGGGKTEAYLGLAAFEIFFRRLSNPEAAGCAVLMRYTLRLLTAQQFQRAASMICACEHLRRGMEADLGSAPITIGLWVGESLTPTRRSDAIGALNKLSGHKERNNPFQLLKCPWCGTELDNSKEQLGYAVSGKPKTVIYMCPDVRCPFSSRSGRLPVVVIDEDIYDAPPTLVIGTVDKFAMLAWRPLAGRLFGLGGVGYDPPGLIIQDELHLISGPLGSVVGLYESAIDLLCSWKGRAPKIVASTATIRRAPQQCRALYNRDIFQFPPQALDISDSYFAIENPQAPGRFYVGVFASAAPSFVTAMVRTLSSLLQSCKSNPLPPGAPESVRDPYWTVIQYFNSLRELGHAATLVEADIPEYMWAIASRDRIARELCRRIGAPVEMTSRRTADEIPKILEQLEVTYPRRESKHGAYPLDTLLATNMISVGVDVDRLGLMVVAGQPKTTSEYIQASSRVGRSNQAPGLIVAMYNPGKPRDRSHYEHFRSFHSAFYRFVEPTSVTPFSIPVLDRALHALLVILARHFEDLSSPRQFKRDSAELTRAIERTRSRCREVDPEHVEMLESRLEQLLKDWETVRPEKWGKFGDPPEARPLMFPAGTPPRREWEDSAWPTPSSMRNVDVECRGMVLARYPEVG